MENPSYDVGCSLKLRLGEEGHIASTPAELRTMSRAVLSQGRAVELLAFRCEANQLRVVAACDEARAHKLDRRLKIQLRRLLHPNVRFGHTWIDVHNDVFKLSRAFKSVVRRSGWAERKDPFDEGSNLLDLLGLRICGGYTIATVKTKLPDIQREFLLSGSASPISALNACRRPGIRWAKRPCRSWRRLTSRSVRSSSPRPSTLRSAWLRPC